MKTYKIRVNVWMTTGHTFSDIYYTSFKPSCEDIEKLMNSSAKKRGFKGLDDIESFETSVKEEK